MEKFSWDMTGSRSTIRRSTGQKEPWILTAADTLLWLTQMLTSQKRESSQNPNQVIVFFASTSLRHFKFAPRVQSRPLWQKLPWMQTRRQLRYRHTCPTMQTFLERRNLTSYRHDVHGIMP